MNDDVNDLIYKFLNGEICLDIQHSTDKDVKKLSNSILNIDIENLTNEHLSLYDYYNECINDTDNWSIVFVDKIYKSYNAYKDPAAKTFCRNCPCYTAYEMLSVTDKSNNISEEDISKLFK